MKRFAEESAIKSFFRDLFREVPAHVNDPQRRFLAKELFGESFPVQSRHDNVGNQEIYMLADIGPQSKSVLRGAGGENFETFRLQVRGKEIADSRFIVDHENHSL